MSGKHVRIRAWLPGGGGLALTVAVAVVSWVAIALFLVLPGSAPTDSRRPAEAGATPARSLASEDPQRPRRDASEGAAPNPAGSASAGQDPLGAGAGGPDATAAATSGGDAAQTASGDDGSEDVRPSHVDPPGKAKGHDKDRDRGPH